MYIKLSSEAKSLLKTLYADYLDDMKKGEDIFIAKRVKCKEILQPMIDEQGFKPFMAVMDELRAEKLIVYLKGDGVVYLANLTDRAIKYMTKKKK